MIALEPHPRGVIVPVRAQPGSRKSEIKGEQNGALKVAVTQAAEKGKANKALIALLGKRLRVRRSQLSLIAGETSQQKRILVEGVPLNELRKRVDELLAE